MDDEVHQLVAQHLLGVEVGDEEADVEGGGGGGEGGGEGASGKIQNEYPQPRGGGKKIHAAVQKSMCNSAWNRKRLMRSLTAPAHAFLIEP